MQKIFAVAAISALMMGNFESNAFLGFGKKPKKEIFEPEIKTIARKTFAVKFPNGVFKTLELEIRDSNDNLMFATKYQDVVNFEKYYDVAQLPRGKYFVTVYADGKVFKDMIRVK